jgi:hypothetical protein
MRLSTRVSTTKISATHLVILASLASSFFASALAGQEGVGSARYGAGQARALARLEKYDGRQEQPPKSCIIVIANSICFNPFRKRRLPVFLLYGI